MKYVLVSFIFVAATTACGEPLGPLPALMEDAHSTGGANFLCQQGQGQGSTPETVSHSPEMVQRLNRDFPPGTAAIRLRETLVQQSFQLSKPCSPDGSIRYAWFEQRGGNGITAMSAYGSVYWREDASGKLIWVTGNILFNGL